MKIIQSHPHLNALGIKAPNRIYWQLNTPQLYEEAVQRHEGYVAHLGPLVVRTGNQTSLAHSDRFIVSEPATHGNISWGEVNRPFDSGKFDELLERVGAYFRGLDVFVQDAYARNGRDSYTPLRVITETAWHNLFVRNSYLHPEPDSLAEFSPEYTVIHAPGFRAIPERDGTNTDVFVITHLTRNLILIGGTSFAGEIQKAIFSLMNYLLPRRDVLTLECASAVNETGDVALFVGVDGSGKSTLATGAANNMLMGDSEHGWDEDGVFSIGRGCYARVFGLNMEDSTDIWQTTRRFGTILENVVVDPQTRYLDLEDGTFTENTRASYPISHVLYATRDGHAGHPHNIILLTKDVFGVLPLVSKLTPLQAHYYFLNGYTGELVKDRYGDVIPQARFTACYGAPFMPLHPGFYARMFADRIKHHNVNVWMVNTGWMGGAYGVGRRIPIETSRAVVRSILNNKLAQANFKQGEHFGLMIPTTCQNIPDESLNPVNAWSDPQSYAYAATDLLKRFEANMSQYQNEVDPAILAAQPGI